MISAVFFVRKINKIRSDIDAVDIDQSVRNALPPDQEVDAAHVFHSFQPLSENAVSTLIRKSAKKSYPLDPMSTSLESCRTSLKRVQDWAKEQ